MSYIRLCNKHLFLRRKAMVFRLEQRKHRHKLTRFCVSLENCSVFWPSKLATRRPFLRNVKWKTLRNVKCKTLLKFTILDVAKRLILSTKTSKTCLNQRPGATHTQRHGAFHSRIAVSFGHPNWQPKGHAASIRPS